MIGTRHHERVQVPPGVPEIPDAVANALREFNALRADSRAARDVLAALQRQRSVAVAADRKALASAVRSGDSDPGDKALLKLDKDIDAAKRKAEALDLAVEESHAELHQLIEQSQPDWLSAIEGRVGDARRRYADALDALELAQAELVAVLGGRGWLRTWPNGKAHLEAYVMMHTTLRGPNGEGTPFDQLVAALREHGEEAGEHRRPTSLPVPDNVRPLQPHGDALSSVGAAGVVPQPSAAKGALFHAALISAYSDSDDESA